MINIEMVMNLNELLEKHWILVELKKIVKKYCNHSEGKSVLFPDR